MILLIQCAHNRSSISIKKQKKVKTNNLRVCNSVEPNQSQQCSTITIVYKYIIIAYTYRAILTMRTYIRWMEKVCTVTKCESEKQFLACLV